MSQSSSDKSGSSINRPLKKGEVILRDHEYDGIQEFDQKLPNWWLFTLYSAIAFSFVYWFFYFQSNVGTDPETFMASESNRIETIKLENSIDVTNNDLFWQMASKGSFIDSGRELYQTNCLSCHGANLEGGIGLPLIKNEWKHGAKPADIYKTIFDGVQSAGMPAWGGQLGQKRIVQIMSYVLSQNDQAAMQQAQ